MVGELLGFGIEHVEALIQFWSSIAPKSDSFAVGAVGGVPVPNEDTGKMVGHVVDSGWELASDLFQNKVGDAAGDEMEP